MTGYPKNQGFFIDLNLTDIKIIYVEQDEHKEFHIHVECTAKSAQCSKCHSVIYKSHGHSKEVSIEHLTIFDRKTWIHVEWPRFFCERCDRTTQFRPEWLGATGRMTIKLENFLLRQMVHSTIMDVSIKFEITEDFLEGLIERRIETKTNFSNINVKIIGIDEIALRKGHGNFITIVSDLSNKDDVKIISVFKGNSESDVLPFLKTIPDAVVAQMTAFCTDMGKGFLSALRVRLSPEDYDRLVVVDRFHVVKSLGSKIDKIRRQEINQLKEKYESDRETLEIIDGTMWPFRKHEENQSEEEKIKLAKLLSLSPNLNELYSLKEGFYTIFETIQSRENAKKEIDIWCDKAISTGHKSLQTFVNTYHQNEKTILNYFNNRCSSGPVEGLNNKIKVIKRRGFGFINLYNFTKRIFLDFNYSTAFLKESAAIS
jgi:transposase